MNMKDQIRAALKKADAVYADESPLLTSFDTEPHDNGIYDVPTLHFSWHDDEGYEWDVYIPESNLEKATLHPDGFSVKDINEENVVLAPYKLTKLF
jgi:hypothetical protein